MGLPIPRKHQDIRHQERSALRAKRTFYLRTCDKTGEKILAIIPGSRSERRDYKTAYQEPLPRDTARYAGEIAKSRKLVLVEPLHYFRVCARPESNAIANAKRMENNKRTARERIAKGEWKANTSESESAALIF